jgi:sodium transport system ATP-binding protein
MIQVNNLHKSFGSVKALNGISFTAPDGQITGLLGPNGAGKTTTLRILYTLLKPDQGKAFIDGYCTQDQRLMAQRQVGAVPDSHGLYPRMTAVENIRYYGELRGMPGSELERNSDRLVRMLEMEDIKNRRTEGFSSGQKVKVAIARALIDQPQNVLLDEPTNGLDVMSTRAMRSFILKLKEECRCVVLSSHIMQEVSALCDNIVIINHGEIAACGSPTELLEASGKENLEEAFVAAIGDSEGLE